MASIFSRIIAGEIPGRLIWRDDLCVAMVDIRPLAPGHTLVIPHNEIDQWIDLSTDEIAHLMTVAHHVGNAQRTVFRPPRIALIIAGFEVPHAHLHVVPAQSMANLDFSTANTHADPAELDRSADRLRATLRAAGHSAVAG